MRNLSGRIAAFIMVVILLTGGVPLTAGAETYQNVDVLFTSDIHSHLDEFMAFMDGEPQNVGGAARIKTLIDSVRTQNPRTIVVDGGDFSMGTLYQTLFETSAAELSVMAAMGYDAATFGNHEFDLRASGLKNMLTVASAQAERPALVVCNIDMTYQNDYTATLEPAFTAYGVTDYIMLEKDGVSIAVTGVFGKDALDCAPTCELKFLDPVESVKKVVQKIRDTEDADMIVCLSHSGMTPDNASTSEDEILARGVPELDVIVSGHKHLAMDEVVRIGNTSVVSCGSYGMYLGHLSLIPDGNGRWTLDSYQLLPVADSIEPDAQIEDTLSGYTATINSSYLSNLGYGSEDVIASSNVTFEQSSLLEAGEHIEYRLGNIISDAMRHAAGTDIAVVPAGMVRDTYYDGDITVSDVFNSYSLGVGPDGSAGYPLVVAYMTGAELRTIAEVDASVSSMMPTARLFMSGMGFKANMSRMFLNRVTDVYIIDASGNHVPVIDSQRYSVAIDLYSCQMLSAVRRKSFGLLSLTPSDAEGKEIKDFTQFIVTRDGAEAKAWMAIVQYLSSFPKNAAGIPEIPQSYATTDGRKTIYTDSSLPAILSAPNKIALLLYAAIAGVVVVIVVVVIVIRRICRRRRKRKETRGTEGIGGTEGTRFS